MAWLGKLGMVLFVLCMFLYSEFEAHLSFFTSYYVGAKGHGNTYNKAKKHYKKNWNFIQRLLWIPLFKERSLYTRGALLLPVLSYVHFIICLIFVIWWSIDVRFRAYLTVMCFGLNASMAIFRFVWNRAMI